MIFNLKNFNFRYQVSKSPTKTQAPHLNSSPTQITSKIFLNLKLLLLFNLKFVRLKTMGSIEQKLTVQAINDEVFQATKEKVASVTEAEKNNS